MSEHDVVQFSDQVLADPGLRARCEAAPDMSSLVTIAAGAGFSFSAEDVRDYATRLRHAQELGENELEAAAGGVTITNNHLVDPIAASLDNSHRDLFGLFELL